MALSLREKLQKASQVNIATNAAKTLEKLDTMELPTSPKIVPKPEGTKPTQSTTDKTTQPPTELPSQLPSRPPSHPPDYPVGDPVAHPATQSPTQSVAHPVNHPLNDSLDYRLDYPSVKSDLWDTLTGPQKRVLRYLVEHQGEIIRYVEIAQAGSMPQATAQTVCKRLKALGVLSSQYGSRGVIKGIRFSLDKRILEKPKPVGYPVNDPSGYPAADPPSRLPSSLPTQQPTHLTTQGPLMKIDRKNLSISLEGIARHWPTLAARGWSVEQMEQVELALAEVGKGAERVVQSLDHAEWELANGQMLDKDGQPVADPCSWVFRALSRTGYYRRPKGYVSPEEQAAKDAEEEARVVIAARQKAESVQFDAWRGGLSDEEMRQAMQGHPGGPKDAWLKSVWKKAAGKS